MAMWSLGAQKETATWVNFNIQAQKLHTLELQLELLFFQVKRKMFFDFDKFINVDLIIYTSYVYKLSILMYSVVKS